VTNLSDSAKVRIIRDKAVWRDRIRDYRVILDHAPAGTLACDSAIDLVVRPGNHQLQLTIDWAKSNLVSFDVSAQETKVFLCKPGLGSPIALLIRSLLGRTGWILLEEQPT
jgi:hypothetical protein